MNDFLLRQSKVFLRYLDGYKAREISLNSMILNLEALCRVEGIADVAGLADWRKEVETALFHIEQYNAYALMEKRHLIAEETEAVGKYLQSLRELAERLPALG